MTQLPKIFSALSDPTRFAIVERLMKEGELPAKAIQAAFDISPPAISWHLSILRDAGLVQSRANKQQRIYGVRPEALRDISNWTLDHRHFWESSLDRLEQALLQKSGAFAQLKGSEKEND